MWMMFVGLSGVQSTTFQQFLQELASGGVMISRKKLPAFVPVFI